MVPIFSTGNPDVQCAMREDGIWFTRKKILMRGVKRWSRWVPMIDQKRPASAWFNPRNGRARLPKETENGQATSNDR
jgi:hypothetical protein